MIDGVGFAQRVVEILDTGRRSSTYKLALLMALVDVCVENEPARDGTLTVPISELAHRVIGYYWTQPDHWGTAPLLQMNGSGLSIPQQASEVRKALGPTKYRTAESAREAESMGYEILVRSVSLRLARMPITHLQNLSSAASSSSEHFIFDATPFTPKMSKNQFDQHPDLVLLPGVPDAFKRTSALLRTVIRRSWTVEVRDMNAGVLADEDDLEHALFGVDRSSLLPLRRPLIDFQDGQCFYCGNALTAAVQIDHVLPFSRSPINGVANLVASDSKCNNSKRDTLPIREHLDRAISRPAADLSRLAALSRFPILLKRTESAAAGLFSTLPGGAPLWRGPADYVPHKS